MTYKWFSSPLIILIVLLFLNQPQDAYAITNNQMTNSNELSNESDVEILNKAVDYFQGGKYHEALLKFKKLQRRYNLNARFKAYIGVCYYYDNDYSSCANMIDSVSTCITFLAPHERSFYYFIAAESHLQLCHYQKAIDYYEKVILLCYDNEKGDVFLGLARCYLAMGIINTAQEYFLSAEAYYRLFNNKYKLSHLQRILTDINTQHQDKNGKLRNQK